MKKAWFPRFIEWVLIGAAFLSSGAAWGQEPAKLEPTKLVSDWVEMDVRYDNVTRGYGDWRGVGVRASVQQGTRDVWYGEAWHQKAFRDEGNYAALTNTHTWSDKWYSHVGVGAGTGDFFFPRWRIDASVSRKWLPSRRLVTTLGVRYVEAMHTNHDKALTGSVLYYFNDRLVGEIGGHLNWSEPGSRRSERMFAALTYGRAKVRYLTLRVGSGTEGYQTVGPSTTNVDFFSKEASLTWREWIGRQWGTNVVLETYDNPFYTRNGLIAGVFYEW